MNTTRQSSPLSTLFALLAFALSSASLEAQVEPKIELQDSRGEAIADSLTIGRSLYVRVDDATPGETYRFALHSRSGDLIDDKVATADASGLVPKTRLFFKSNIWAPGCQPGGGGTIPSGGSDDLFGPFDSLPEAAAALDGAKMWLSIEIESMGAGGGPAGWSPVDTLPLTLVAPQEAVYYWSDADGYEECYFDSPADVHLSVYRGDLEDFDISRVFMLHRPSKGEWKVGYDFDEVRYKEGCISTDTDDCSYEEGSEETLPSTITIPMRGHLPKHGEFIALIRGGHGPGGPQGSVRHRCDRATEGSVFIKELPHLTENQEGWGCPPCTNN